MRIFVPQPSLGREEWLVLIDGGKRDNRFDVYSTSEKMEMNRNNVGSLKSERNFTNPLGFSSTTSYCVNAKLRIWWASALS